MTKDQPVTRDLLIAPLVLAFGMVRYTEKPPFSKDQILVAYNVVSVTDFTVYQTYDVGFYSKNTLLWWTAVTFHDVGLTSVFHEAKGQAKSVH